MEGRIDCSFTTEQRDLFTSGIIAELGVNAYATWQAIKCYADFNTGEAFPGMRTLGEKLGLSRSTIQRAVDKLVEYRMLRVKKCHTRRRGQTYVARERLRVTVGSAVICTIILDYVPQVLRQRLARIENAMATGERDPEAFADAEIIPGPGFEWDAAAGLLRGKVDASTFPPEMPDPDDEYLKIGEMVLSKIAPTLKGRLPKK